MGGTPKLEFEFLLCLWRSLLGSIMDATLGGISITRRGFLSTSETIFSTFSYSDDLDICMALIYWESLLPLAVCVKKKKNLDDVASNLPIRGKGNGMLKVEVYIGPSSRLLHSQKNGIIRSLASCSHASENRSTASILPIMKCLFITFFATLLVSLQLVSSQLSGSVGPLTTRAAKSAKKTCNVLDYGATASTTSDIGPALTSAFEACISGGTVYVPPGSYGMETWVTLNGGNAWALQLDGVIYRTGTAGGNMIFIEHSTDFELYSSTSKGAIQGYGYTFHEAGTYGPRILRLSEVTDFSIHDIALVDSPQFHLTLDTCTNGEVYNTIIRGGNEGGLDGIDVWGTNIWIHDVEVTNKDECVTVKSPADHILVENIYCNWSGGCAIGSLGSNTDISYITYENIYTWESNQMFMIKSNGGNGSVSNSNFNNFIGHSNAYSLDINAFWEDVTLAPGNGVLYTDLTFNNWTGTCSNGAQRGPIQVLCPSEQPCDGITISDFAMWTETGSVEYFVCENAWGSGGCLAHGTAHTAYSATTSSVTTAPSGYAAAKMPSDLASGFPLTASIPIPAVPTTFFPGATPISKLLG